MKHGLTGPALKEWRESHRLSQEELGELLSTSREWIGKMEREEREISADKYLRFEQLKRDPRFSSPKGVIHEDHGGYRISGSLEAGKTGKESPPSRSLLQPHFTPPPAIPTRQDVEAYLKEYLDHAERVPGAIAHAYIELTEALPLEKIKRRAERADAPI